MFWLLQGGSVQGLLKDVLIARDIWTDVLIAPRWQCTGPIEGCSVCEGHMDRCSDCSKVAVYRAYWRMFWLRGTYGQMFWLLQGGSVQGLLKDVLIARDIWTDVLIAPRWQCTGPIEGCSDCEGHMDRCSDCSKVAVYRAYWRMFWLRGTYGQMFWLIQGGSVQGLLKDVLLARDIWTDVLIAPRWQCTGPIEGYSHCEGHMDRCSDCSKVAVYRAYWRMFLLRGTYGQMFWLLQGGSVQDLLKDVLFARDIWTDVLIAPRWQCTGPIEGCSHCEGHMDRCSDCSKVAVYRAYWRMFWLRGTYGQMFWLLQGGSVQGLLKDVLIARDIWTDVLIAPRWQCTGPIEGCSYCEGHMDRCSDCSKVAVYMAYWRMLRGYCEGHMDRCSDCSKVAVYRAYWRMFLLRGTYGQMFWLLQGGSVWPARDIWTDVLAVLFARDIWTDVLIAPRWQCTGPIEGCSYCEGHMDRCSDCSKVAVYRAYWRMFWLRGTYGQMFWLLQGGSVQGLLKDVLIARDIWTDVLIAPRWQCTGPIEGCSYCEGHMDRCSDCSKVAVYRAYWRMFCLRGTYGQMFWLLQGGSVQGLLKDVLIARDIWTDVLIAPRWQCTGPIEGCSDCEGHMDRCSDCSKVAVYRAYWRMFWLRGTYGQMFWLLQGGSVQGLLKDVLIARDIWTDVLIAPRWQCTGPIEGCSVCEGHLDRCFDCSKVAVYRAYWRMFLLRGTYGQMFWLLQGGSVLGLLKDVLIARDIWTDVLIAPRWQCTGPIEGCSYCEGHMDRCSDCSKVAVYRAYWRMFLLRGTYGQMFWLLQGGSVQGLLKDVLIARDIWTDVLIAPRWQCTRAIEGCSDCEGYIDRCSDCSKVAVYRAYWRMFWLRGTYWQMFWLLQGGSVQGLLKDVLIARDIWTDVLIAPRWQCTGPIEECSIARDIWTDVLIAPRWQCTGPIEGCSYCEGHMDRCSDCSKVAVYMAYWRMFLLRGTYGQMFWLLQGGSVQGLLKDVLLARDIWTDVLIAPRWQCTGPIEGCSHCEEYMFWLLQGGSVQGLLKDVLIARDIWTDVLIAPRWQCTGPIEGCSYCEGHMDRCSDCSKVAVYRAYWRMFLLRGTYGQMFWLLQGGSVQGLLKDVLIARDIWTDVLIAPRWLQGLLKDVRLRGTYGQMFWLLQGGSVQGLLKDVLIARDIWTDVLIAPRWQCTGPIEGCSYCEGHMDRCSDCSKVAVYMAYWRMFLLRGTYGQMFWLLQGGSVQGLLKDVLIARDIWTDVLIAPRWQCTGPIEGCSYCEGHMDRCSDCSKVAVYRAYWRMFLLRGTGCSYCEGYMDRCSDCSKVAVYRAYWRMFLLRGTYGQMFWLLQGGSVQGLLKDALIARDIWTDVLIAPRWQSTGPIEGCSHCEGHMDRCSDCSKVAVYKGYWRMFWLRGIYWQMFWLLQGGSVQGLLKDVLNARDILTDVLIAPRWQCTGSIEGCSHCEGHMDRCSDCSKVAVYRAYWRMFWLRGTYGQMFWLLQGCSVQGLLKDVLIARDIWTDVLIAPRWQCTWPIEGCSYCEGHMDRCSDCSKVAVYRAYWRMFFLRGTYGQMFWLLQGGSVQGLLKDVLIARNIWTEVLIAPRWQCTGPIEGCSDCEGHMDRCSDCSKVAVYRAYWRMFLFRGTYGQMFWLLQGGSVLGLLKDVLIARDIWTDVLIAPRWQCTGPIEGCSYCEGHMDRCSDCSKVAMYRAYWRMFWLRGTYGQIFWLLQGGSVHGLLKDVLIARDIWTDVLIAPRWQCTGPIEGCSYCEGHMDRCSDCSKVAVYRAYWRMFSLRGTYGQMFWLLQGGSVQGLLKDVLIARDILTDVLIAPRWQCTGPIEGCSDCEGHMDRCSDCSKVAVYRAYWRMFSLRGTYGQMFWLLQGGSVQGLLKNVLIARDIWTDVLIAPRLQCTGPIEGCSYCEGHMDRCSDCSKVAVYMAYWRMFLLRGTYGQMFWLLQGCSVQGLLKDVLLARDIWIDVLIAPRWQCTGPIEGCSHCEEHMDRSSDCSKVTVYRAYWRMFLLRGTYGQMFWLLQGGSVQGLLKDVLIARDIWTDVLIAPRWQCTGPIEGCSYCEGHMDRCSDCSKVAVYRAYWRMFLLRGTYGQMFWLLQGAMYRAYWRMFWLRGTYGQMFWLLQGGSVQGLLKDVLLARDIWTDVLIAPRWQCTGPIEGCSDCEGHMDRCSDCSQVAVYRAYWRMFLLRGTYGQMFWLLQGGSVHGLLKDVLIARDIWTDVLIAPRWQCTGPIEGCSSCEGHMDRCSDCSKVAVYRAYWRMFSLRGTYGPKFWLLQGDSVQGLLKDVLIARDIWTDVLIAPRWQCTGPIEGCSDCEGHMDRCSDCSKVAVYRAYWRMFCLRGTYGQMFWLLQGGSVQDLLKDVLYARDIWTDVLIAPRWQCTGPIEGCSYCEGHMDRCSDCSKVAVYWAYWRMFLLRGTYGQMFWLLQGGSVQGLLKDVLIARDIWTDVLIAPRWQCTGPIEGCSYCEGHMDRCSDCSKVAVYRAYWRMFSLRGTYGQMFWLLQGCSVQGLLKDVLIARDILTDVLIAPRWQCTGPIEGCSDCEGHMDRCSDCSKVAVYRAYWRMFWLRGTYGQMFWLLQGCSVQGLLKDVLIARDIWTDVLIAPRWQCTGPIEGCSYCEGHMDRCSDCSKVAVYRAYWRMFFLRGTYGQMFWLLQGGSVQGLLKDVLIARNIWTEVLIAPRWQCTGPIEGCSDCEGHMDRCSDCSKVAVYRAYWRMFLLRGTYGQMFWLLQGGSVPGLLKDVLIARDIWTDVLIAPRWQCTGPIEGCSYCEGHMDRCSDCSKVAMYRAYWRMFWLRGTYGQIFWLLQGGSVHGLLKDVLIARDIWTDVLIAPRWQCTGPIEGCSDCEGHMDRCSDCSKVAVYSAYWRMFWLRGTYGQMFWLLQGGSVQGLLKDVLIARDIWTDVLIAPRWQCTGPIEGYSVCEGHMDRCSDCSKVAVYRAYWRMFLLRGTYGQMFWLLQGGSVQDLLKDVLYARDIWTDVLIAPRWQCTGPIEGCSSCEGHMDRCSDCSKVAVYRAYWRMFLLRGTYGQMFWLLQGGSVQDLLKDVLFARDIWTDVLIAPRWQCTGPIEGCSSCEGHMDRCSDCSKVAVYRAYWRMFLLRGTYGQMFWLLEGGSVQGLFKDVLIARDIWTDVLIAPRWQCTGPIEGCSYCEGHMDRCSDCSKVAVYRAYWRMFLLRGTYGQMFWLLQGGSVHGLLKDVLIARDIWTDVLIAPRWQCTWPIEGCSVCEGHMDRCSDCSKVAVYMAYWRMFWLRGTYGQMFWLLQGDSVQGLLKDVLIARDILTDVLIAPRWQCTGPIEGCSDCEGHMDRCSDCSKVAVYRAYWRMFWLRGTYGQMFWLLQGGSVQGLLKDVLIARDIWTDVLIAPRWQCTWPIEGCSYCEGHMDRCSDCSKVAVYIAYWRMFLLRGTYGQMFWLLQGCSVQDLLKDVLLARDIWTDVLIDPRWQYTWPIEGCSHCEEHMDRSSDCSKVTVYRAYWRMFWLRGTYGQMFWLLQGGSVQGLLKDVLIARDIWTDVLIAPRSHCTGPIEGYSVCEGHMDRCSDCSKVAVYRAYWRMFLLRGTYGQMFWLLPGGSVQGLLKDVLIARDIWTDVLIAPRWQCTGPIEGCSYCEGHMDRCSDCSKVAVYRAYWRMFLLRGTYGQMFWLLQGGSVQGLLKDVLIARDIWTDVLIAPRWQCTGPIEGCSYCEGHMDRCSDCSKVAVYMAYWRMFWLRGTYGQMFWLLQGDSVQGLLKDVLIARDIWTDVLIAPRWQCTGPIEGCSYCEGHMDRCSDCSKVAVYRAYWRMFLLRGTYGQMFWLLQGGSVQGLLKDVFIATRKTGVYGYGRKSFALQHATIHHF